MTAIALAEIAQPTLSERIQLVEDLWDAVAAALDGISLMEPQREELERRLQASRQNPHPLSGSLTAYSGAKMNPAIVVQ